MPPLPHPTELGVRAVRMGLDHADEHGSQWDAICSAAEGWVRGPRRESWGPRAEADEGRRPGQTGEELAEVKRLKREKPELRRANDIRTAASSYWAWTVGRNSTVAAKKLHAPQLVSYRQSSSQGRVHQRLPTSRCSISVRSRRMLSGGVS